MSTNAYFANLKFFELCLHNETIFVMFEKDYQPML